MTESGIPSIFSHGWMSHHLLKLMSHRVVSYLHPSDRGSLDSRRCLPRIRSVDHLRHWMSHPDRFSILPHPKLIHWMNRSRENINSRIFVKHWIERETSTGCLKLLLYFCLTCREIDFTIFKSNKIILVWIGLRWKRITWHQMTYPKNGRTKTSSHFILLKKDLPISKVL